MRNRDGGSINTSQEVNAGEKIKERQIQVASSNYFLFPSLWSARKPDSKEHSKREEKSAEKERRNKERRVFVSRDVFPSLLCITNLKEMKAPWVAK